MQPVVKHRFQLLIRIPFGHVWEDLAVTAAEYGLGSGQKGVRISGTVKQERLRRISEILNRLEHSSRGQGRVRPDWDTELAYIMEGDGEDIPVQIECDVFFLAPTRQRGSAEASVAWVPRRVGRAKRNPPKSLDFV